MIKYSWLFMLILCNTRIMRRRRLRTLVTFTTRVNVVVTAAYYTPAVTVL